MSLSIYPPLHPIYPDEWSSVPFDLQAPRQPSPLHRDQSSPWHCPYSGLASFSQDSPHFLFGRQATLQLLLTHLRQFNVVPLIGPVGSGKSSFSGVTSRRWDALSIVIAIYAETAPSPPTPLPLWERGLDIAC